MDSAPALGQGTAPEDLPEQTSAQAPSPAENQVAHMADRACQQMEPDGTAERAMETKVNSIPASAPMPHLAPLAPRSSNHLVHVLLRDQAPQAVVQPEPAPQEKFAPGSFFLPRDKKGLSFSTLLNSH